MPSPSLPCCSFAQMRQRAFQLADSGRYAHWADVGAALEEEACVGALERIADDVILQRILDARCCYSDTAR